MKYNFKITKESLGFSADCIELKGCRTQADTMEQLEKNMSEALNLFLSEDENSRLVFKPAKLIKQKNIFPVAVDPAVVLAMSVRQARLKAGKTQKEMMLFLNIKNLSNYQRLENPKKANPEFKTLIRLVQKLPSLNIVEIINSYKVKT